MHACFLSCSSGNIFKKGSYFLVAKLQVSGFLLK